jgi:hypothetical protein
VGSARSRLAVLTALAGAALVAAAAQAAVPDPRVRLPDLTVEEPSAITVVERAGPDSAPHWYLGFDSATYNAGAGPLVVEGRRARRSQTTMTATQLVLGRGSRKAVRRARIGTLKFVVSPDHRHWHLQDYLRYELRDAVTGRLVRPDLKTGFCLGDRYAGRGVDRAPRYQGMCGQGRPDLLRVREGISSGFGDVYGAYLEGQEIDITGVPAGEYVLLHRVNPRRRLLEQRYDNNVSCVALTLSWPATGPPTLADRSASCR